MLETNIDNRLRKAVSSDERSTRYLLLGAGVEIIVRDRGGKLTINTDAAIR